MKSKISIYGHYGSYNHGNEAIIRGFKEIFPNNDILLFSYLPETDFEYQLDNLVKIYPFVSEYKKISIQRILRGIFNRLLKNKRIIHKNTVKPFMKNIDGIYLLEAGDQYCENDNVRDFYSYVNEHINSNGGKTIMLPATINVNSLNDIKLINDLNRYSLIFARESITYEGLIKAGLTNKVRYVPDTAFVMKAQECELPDIFHNRKIVGITIGMLSQGKEKCFNDMYENTKSLISYILNETEYGVALIPHVNVGKNLNDPIPLQSLYNNFSSSDRVVYVPEQRADKQKFVIGQCNFIVTLRTHVSIAAYSQAIPTIVIGYSQKSKGLAKDMFGSYENYVIDVDLLKDKSKLTYSFKWLVSNEGCIRKKYDENLSAYISKVYKLYDEIKVIGETRNE